ncbi:hypothetical protein [Sphingobium aromaticiconvertens]|uniref:hypothetical protein n=1 Tax=Sphingobium aromaticiconvertens TaxID=365341 RepID=UPI0030196282
MGVEVGNDLPHARDRRRDPVDEMRASAGDEIGLIRVQGDQFRAGIGESRPASC